MGPEDRPLTGFSWRGGCERDTTGILAWSEILMVDGPDGEKVDEILLSFLYYSFLSSSKFGYRLPFYCLTHKEHLIVRAQLEIVLLFLL